MRKKMRKMRKNANRISPPPLPKSEVAHWWAKWLCHPCRLGDPHRFRAGGKIRSGPLVGKVATSPLPSRGSPPLQSRGKIRSGPLVGKVATSPLPSRGSPPIQSGGGGIRSGPLVGKVATLRHPCHLGDPHRLRAGGKIRSGPLVGKVATSPLPSRGSPPIQSGGKIRSGPLVGKVATSPLPSRDPHRFRAGGEIRSGPQVGKVATSPLPSRGSHCCRAGGEIRSGPLVGKVATSPLPSRGSPPLQSGGLNQKWPTCGQSGYVTPAVSGIPTAAERGGKSEVAHKWAKWLRHPCRLGDPHRCRAGGEIRSGPLVGKVLLLVSFQLSLVVNAPGPCWMWHGVPFAHQRRQIVSVLRLYRLLPGSFDCFCCPHGLSITSLPVFLCA